MTIYILFLISFIFPATPLLLKELHQVLIIGAGISGLRASQILTEQYISHLVLESTDHVGGRIIATSFDGVSVDKGASFIHDSLQNNPLGELVEILKWPWINGTWSYEAMYCEGGSKRAIPSQEVAVVQKMYFELTESVKSKLQKAKDVSIFEAVQTLIEQKYLKETKERKRLVQFMFKLLGNIDGSEISQLSAKMTTYQQSLNDLIPSQGFHQFFKAIFRNISKQVLLNQRVHTIDFSSEIIKVHTDKQVFYAKKVISSIPLGVLKARKVKFVPALPTSHSESIDKIGNGYADKLFVSFKDSLWGNHTGWLSFITKNRENKYPIALIIPNSSNHHLLFFVSGKASLKLSKWTEDQIIEDLYNFLTLFFKSSCIEIKAVKLTKWHQDENALGSYSNYKVGTTQRDFEKLSQPIDAKLWFIGQHTTPKANAYAHGAYLTGQKAAQQVSALLKSSAKRQVDKTAKKYQAYRGSPEQSLSDSE